MINTDIAQDPTLFSNRVLKPTGRSSDSVDATAAISPKNDLIFADNNLAPRKNSVSSAGVNTVSMGSSNTMSIVKKFKAMKFAADKQVVDHIYIEDSLPKNKMELNNKTGLEVIVQGKFKLHIADSVGGIDASDLESENTLGKRAFFAE